MKRNTGIGAAALLWLLAACSQKPATPEPATPAALSAASQTSSAATPSPTTGQLAPAPPAAAGALAYLEGLVGRYPEDSGLFATQPLADRLTALLGPDLGVLQRNLQVKSPLQKEGGVYYLTGNQQHSGGTDAAALVIDPAQDVIYVILLTGGARSEYVERGVKPSLPNDVQTLLSNWR